MYFNVIFFYFNVLQCITGVVRTERQNIDISGSTECTWECSKLYNIYMVIVVII